MRRTKSRGFTLIELLIIVGILGLLFQLMLPAIESAREAARRSQCQNNLRQVALAFQLHHDAHEHYPTGGWGWSWIGHPDRGFGRKQPGGWAYNILPFIERQNIRSLGSSLPEGSDEQREAILQANSTVIPLFYCPSRRLPRAYPYRGSLAFVLLPERCVEKRGACKLARTDYAVNSGNINHWPPGRRGPGPDTLEAGDGDWQKDWIFGELNRAEQNGISYQRSEVRMAQILDGTSNTYCAGEKYMPIGDYHTGRWSGDDSSAFGGHDIDTHRWTGMSNGGAIVPLMDSEVANKRTEFGSSHLAGLNMAFCDGSVHLVTYDVDPEIHRLQGGGDDEKLAEEKAAQPPAP